MTLQVNDVGLHKQSENCNTFSYVFRLGFEVSLKTSNSLRVGTRELHSRCRISQKARDPVWVQTPYQGRQVFEDPDSSFCFGRGHFVNLALIHAFIHRRRRSSFFCRSRLTDPFLLSRSVSVDHKSNWILTGSSRTGPDPFLRTPIYFESYYFPWTTGLG